MYDLLQAPSSKLQTSSKLQGSIWCLPFFWILGFGSWSLVAQPIISTTPYTRYLLLSPDAPTARSRLGITNLFGLGSFDTNIFVITGTNITIRNPVVLTNVVLVGGIQGLTYDPNIFQLAGTNISVVDPLVLTNISLLKNTISPVVDLGSPSVSLSVDVSTSIEFRVTLTNNLALTFTGWSDGHPVRLRVANTGSFALTFATTMYWYPNGNSTQVTNDWGNGINNTFAFFKDNGVIYASDKEGIGTSGAGGVSGGGVAPEVAYWSSGSALTGNTNFVYSAAGTQLLLRNNGGFPIQMIDDDTGSSNIFSAQFLTYYGTPGNGNFTFSVNGTNSGLYLKHGAGAGLIALLTKPDAGVIFQSSTTSASRTNQFLGIPVTAGNPTANLIPNFNFNTAPIAYDVSNNLLFLWNFADTNWHSLGTVIVATNIFPGNPTGSVGLTAVNGTGTNYMRADAALPLSQQIAPTWRAQHIWDRGLVVGTNTSVNLGGLSGTTNGEVFVAVFDRALSDPSRVYQLLEVATDLQHSSEAASWLTFVNSTNAYAYISSTSSNGVANLVRLGAATNYAQFDLLFDSAGAGQVTNSLGVSTNLAQLRMQDSFGDSITLKLDTTAPSLVFRVASAAHLTLDPSAADGATPYTMDTTSWHDSGKLFDVQNGSVSKFAIDHTGSPLIPLNAVSGYVLKSDGAGRATWQAAAGEVAGGVEGSVQFNTGGAFDGDSTFLWAGNVLSIAGELDFTATNTLSSSGADLVYLNGGTPTFKVSNGAGTATFGLNAGNNTVIDSGTGSIYLAGQLDSLTIIPQLFGTYSLGNNSTTGSYLDLYVTGRHVWNGATNNLIDTWGVGTPEGAVTARTGSLYRRADGGASTTIYAKGSGTGNTGWTALAGGGGPSAPVGTMVESGISSTGVVPATSDTTGTNFVASPLIVSTVTNIFIRGRLSANTLQVTNIGPSRIVKTDSEGRFTPVGIGANITFDGFTISATSGPIDNVWTNDNTTLKPAGSITNKLWLSDSSPYVVRIDTGGAFPITDNDRLLEINNFQTNVFTVAPEGGIQIGRNSRSFWNSIADNAETLVSVRVAAGQTINDVPFNQIYIGTTNIGNMGFFDVETLTNAAFVTVGVNTPKATLNGDGSLVLWDSAGTHQVRLQTAASTTTNLNVIFPAAPTTGLLLATLTAGTNLTLSTTTALQQAVSNNIAASGLLAVDATKTNGIAATLAHITNAAGWTGETTKFVNGAGVVSALPTITNSFGVHLDGGGLVLATGVAGYSTIVNGGTIQSCVMLADQTGSAIVDIWRCTYGQFDAGSTHPVAGDKITSSAPPTITSAVKSTNALTGWSLSVTNGDVIAWSVTSCSTITKLDILVNTTR